eukprot:3254975-Lingulodinium_polyedra.AAC.1
MLKDDRLPHTLDKLKAIMVEKIKWLEELPIGYFEKLVQVVGSSGSPPECSRPSECLHCSRSCRSWVHRGEGLQGGGGPPMAFVRGGHRSKPS